MTTIIFDLSEVYLYGMKNVERRIEKVLGINIRDRIDNGEESDQFFLGQITEEEFWQKIIYKYHWDIDVATLKRLIRENMTEIEGTRKIIEALRENGYILGLLSTHGKELIEYCEEKFDYHKLFHSVMYSYEAGVCKPNPKAFELILEKLHVSPTECLFIDDRFKNIETASKLGMQTIHFENAQQLKEELYKLNVKS